MTARHRKPRTRAAQRVRDRLDRYCDRSVPVVVMTGEEWVRRHPQ